MRPLLKFDPEWMAEFVPTVLPSSYECLGFAADGASYRRLIDGMTVILSGAVELDGHRWLHVSCAHPRRLPRWHDLREVKDIFVGQNRTAVQVLPRAEKHVNIHPNCLHLFSCLDGNPLPDFTQGGRTL